MLTSENGNAAIFPNIDHADSRPAIRLPPRNHLLSLVLDLCAIIFLPALKICVGTAAGNPPHYVAFWTLVAAISTLLIYVQGGYHRAAPLGDLKHAGLAAGDFLATSFVMLAASYLSVDHATAPSPWTVGEVCLVPAFLLAIRYLRSAQMLPFRPVSVSAGPMVIYRDSCVGDLNAFLAEADRLVPAPRVVSLENLRREGHEAGDDPAANRGILDQVSNHRVQDVIFVNQSSLENIHDSIPATYFRTLLIQPIRFWLAVDTALEFNRPFVAGSRKYTLIPLCPTGLVTSKTRSKRIFDLIGASLLLISCIPVLLIVACLVRISGPGPIIFRQRRVGAQGRDFTVLKFRTMKDAPGSSFEQARLNDERTTKIGRFLRRSSLDELLQLINVLRGDMSLVGPRPHAPETQVNGICFDAALDLYRLRHRVKPGITGLAQIRGLRGATQNIDTLRLRTESDLEYIATWSLWLDFTIILKSIAVFVRHDAY